MKFSLNITERDISTLAIIAKYSVMTTNQICRCSGTPRRSQRRRNRILSNANLLNRCDIFPQFGGSPVPAYSITKDAAHLLAQHFGVDEYIENLLPMPAKQYVPHAVAVTDTHITLNESLVGQEYVTLPNWFHEGAKVGSDPITGSKRTTIVDFGIPPTTKGRVTCCPDFVAQINAGENSCLFFGEEDRDTYWANKAIARKLPGYKRLFVCKYHRVHFADAIAPVPDPFRIVFIAPTPSRRDALRRNAVKLMKKEDPEFRDLWRFTSKTGANALTPESFLHGEIFFKCDEDATPQSLVVLRKHENGQATGLPVSTGHPNGQLENV